MSYLGHLGRRAGNQLYKLSFPIYRPLYSAFKHYADREERQLISRNLPLGSVAVDAGANIGLYSEFLSKCVGPAGAVHSFEPSPDNFQRLQQTTKGLPNIRLNQLAVSETTGDIVLYISDDLNVDHRTYPTEGETRRTVRIRSTALDDYFQAGARVDLIKMDIQGYELHALRGARRVLTENPHVKLLLEYWPYGLHHAGSSSGDLFAFLKELGFKAFSSGSELQEQPARTGAEVDNPGFYLNVFAHRLAANSYRP